MHTHAGSGLYGGIEKAWLFLQTPSSTLGVALHFQNYELKPKDTKSCVQGWWKISEIM